MGLIFLKKNFFENFLGLEKFLKFPLPNLRKFADCPAARLIPSSFEAADLPNRKKFGSASDQEFNAQGPLISREFLLALLAPKTDI